MAEISATVCRCHSTQTSITDAWSSSRPGVGCSTDDDDALGRCRDCHATVCEISEGVGDRCPDRTTGSWSLPYGAGLTHEFMIA
jgi:hypothetical protein